MGNKKLNSVWENNIPEGFVRITSQSTRSERVSWITNKYVLGRFRNDFVPSGPKMYNKKDEMKNFFVASLKEDNEFRNNLVSLIFGIEMPNVK